MRTWWPCQELVVRIIIYLDTLEVYLGEGCNIYFFPFMNILIKILYLEPYIHVWMTNKWAVLCKNMSLGICGQRRPKTACASMQSDHCLLIESLQNIWMESKGPDNTLCMCRMIWMCILCMFEGTFLLDLALMLLELQKCELTGGRIISGSSRSSRFLKPVHSWNWSQ